MKYTIFIFFIINSFSLFSQGITEDSLFSLLNVDNGLSVKEKEKNEVEYKVLSFEDRNTQCEYLVDKDSVVFAVMGGMPINIWQETYNYLKKNKSVLHGIDEDYYSYNIEYFYYGGIDENVETEKGIKDDTEFMVITDLKYYYLKAFNNSESDTVFLLNKFKNKNTYVYFFSQKDTDGLSLIGGYWIENGSSTSFFKDKLILPVSKLVFAYGFVKLVVEDDEEDDSFTYYNYTTDNPKVKKSMMKFYHSKFHTFKKIMAFYAGLELAR